VADGELVADKKGDQVQLPHRKAPDWPHLQ